MEERQTSTEPENVTTETVVQNNAADEQYATTQSKIDNVKPQIAEKLSVEKEPVEKHHGNEEAEKEKASSGRGSELDKFKRRLIRAIARLLFKEKKPESEVWTELKKETGCDCEMLWKRMRALTIKKLDRMFQAEDLLENITRIARLSVTDWLMFDLILVHEDVNVIGQVPEGAQHLEDLFHLVLKYNIEKLSGDALVKAWFEATLEYNGSERKCSPMLLQRRWYQLKESVRMQFYEFWFLYRGNPRLLSRATEKKPKGLHVLIGKSFRHLITGEFVSWEDLIKDKKVALPEDFERLQLAKKKIFHNENAPDIEVIETPVETIDLGKDSSDEDEESRDSVTTSADPETNVTCAVIKSEPVDDLVEIEEPLKEVVEVEEEPADDVLEVDEEQHAPVVEHDTLTKEAENVVSNCKASNVDNINEKSVDEDVTVIDQDVEMFEDHVTFTDGDVALVDTESCDEDNFDIMMPKITSVTSAAEIIDATDDNPVDEVNNILEDVAESLSKNKLDNIKIPAIVNSLNTNQIVRQEKTNMPATLDKSLNKIKVEISNKLDNIEIPNTEDTLNTNEIDKHDNINMPATSYDSLNNLKVDISNKTVDLSSFEVPNDYNFIDDGIELEDDGIVFQEDADDFKAAVPLPTSKIKTEEDAQENNDEDTPKIDLKLLLTPVVYTKKLDQMDVFRFIDYDLVKDKRVLETAAIESKPIDRKAVKMEDISQECQQPSPEDDDDSDNSDYHHDHETIKYTSWYFQKPKTRKYNPILLCKNPDFNTRLKWLSAAFFAIERNRYLLKQCKPMTIDVHKAFEAKLVNNTLYLNQCRFTGATQTPEVKKENIEKPAETEPTPDILIEPKQEIFVPAPDGKILTPPDIPVNVNERSKVINLPDIDQIRRLNQRLLTAEVTPIQITNGITNTPVKIVDTPCVESNVHEDNKDLNNIDVNPPISNTLSEHETLIKNMQENDNRSSVTSNIEKAKTNVTVIQSGVFSSNNRQPKAKQNQAKPKPKNSQRLQRPVAPWLVNNRIIPTSRNDCLLTDDTVIKILDLCAGVQPKQKEKSKCKHGKKGRPFKNESEVIDSNKTALNVNSKINESGSSEVETSLSSISTEVKDSVSGNTLSNESSAEVEKSTNDTSKAKEDSNEGKKRKKKVTVKIDDKTGKFTYCCWSQQKIIMYRRTPFSTHSCPILNCSCCCKIRLSKVIEKRRKWNRNRSRPIEVSDDECPETDNTPNNVLSEKVDSSKKTPPPVKVKVSIGVNTDFTNDENVNDISTVKQPITVELNKSIDVQGSQIHVSNQAYISNNVNNLNKDLSNDISSIRTYNRPNVHACRTKIKRGIPHRFLQNPKPCTNVTISKPKPASDLRLTTDTNSLKTLLVPSQEIIDKLSKTPICLGKNKILLCCTKKPDEVFNTNTVEHNVQPQITLPKGVNIVLLPNQELVLSLQPGVELTNEQLSTLPAILNAIQNQLQASGHLNPSMGTDNLTDQNNPDNVIQLSDEENSTINKDISDSSNKPIDNNLTDTDNATMESSAAEKVLTNEVTQSITNLDENNVGDISEIHVDGTKTPINISNEIITSTDDKDCTTEITDVTTATNIDKNTSDDSYANDKAQSNECTTEIYDVPIAPNIGINTSDETNVSDKPQSNDCTTEMNDVTTTKKTILSDLMEMSGIFAEDTNMNEQPTESQTVEPIITPIWTVPQVTPTPQNVETHHTSNPEPEKSSMETKQVSIPADKSGKTSNSLLNNPLVLAAFMRCPELSPVCSFIELREAHENNALFYKMDIETGVIVPINICIKKQIVKNMNKNLQQKPKIVVDLTDDNDDDSQSTITTNMPTGNTETNETTTVTLEVNTEIHKEGETVRPLKLFKSVRPYILKRNSQSLLNSTFKNSLNKKINKERIMRILNNSNNRKQNLNVKTVDNINLDSDSDENVQMFIDNSVADKDKIFVIRRATDNDSKDNNKTETDSVSDRDSDSDDEPLAIKAKRMRRSPKHDKDTDMQLSYTKTNKLESVNKENPGSQNVAVENVSTATGSTNNITKGGMGGEIGGVNEEEVYEDVEMLESEFLDTPSPVHLEPVVFGENDSEEDDCILGV